MLHSIPMVFDRSMRSFDRDGHLFVEMTNISKANVCTYLGAEIPGYEQLVCPHTGKMGLDAAREYRLYRDPEELRKGAHTFAGKPLLMHHKPATATDHPEELVVGSIGTNVTFDGLYLRSPLSIWTREAIDGVLSERQRELSPGYRFEAVMVKGMTPDGVAFDGRMTQIMGNHLALVFEGRTGHDVVVADSKPPELSKMKFSKFLAALGTVTTIKPDAAQALDNALVEDMKANAPPIVVDSAGLTDAEQTLALDTYSKASGKAMDSFTDADKIEAFKRAKASKDKPVMDAAISQAVAAAVLPLQQKLDGVEAAHADALKIAQDTARAEVHALYSARKAVESIVGEVVLDSAEAVYRFALDHLKVDHKTLPSAALAALYEASTKAAPVVQDSAAFVFDPSILGTSHIRKG